MTPISGELERHALAQLQRAQRQQFRALLQVKFAGDPIARQRLDQDWRPLIEFAQDMALTPDDAADWEGPAGNQDLNP